MFIGWTSLARSAALASAIGAVLYEPGGRIMRRLPWPLRYALQAVATVCFLLRARPRNVIFVNPPFLTGLPPLLLKRALRLTLFADAHSGAFNDPRWQRFARVNAFVLARCRAVIVTNGRLASDLRASGVSAICIASPPVIDRTGPMTSADGPIAATLSYSFDEPVAELLDGARRAPSVQLALTGSAPDWVRRQAPANCQVTGWLSQSDYQRLLARARAVVCLTTREATMQTGAWEALEYARPLILSGTQTLRELFGYDGVVFLDDHRPETIAAALETVWHHYREFEADARRAQPAVMARAARQIAGLADLLGCPACVPNGS